MKRYSFGAILALFFLIQSGCGSNNSTPSSPATGPTPAPSFNYAFNLFFGTSGPSTMRGPVAIRRSGAILWVVNYFGNSLQAWTTGGSLSKAVTSYNSIAFNTPTGVGVGPDGYVYVTDGGSSQVVEFNPTGQYVTVFGNAQLGADFPVGVAVNSSYAFLLDYTANQVIRYTVGGSGNSKTFTGPITFGTTATSGASGALQSPQNLTVDSQGTVYVTDNVRLAVMKYDPSGVFQGSVTAGLAGPIDVQLDGAGYYYIADSGNHNIQVLSPSGAAVTHFGDTQLAVPYGVSLDAAGNAYVLDYSNNQVVVFQKQ